MVMKLTMILLLAALISSACSWGDASSRTRTPQAENRQLYEIYQQYMQSMNAQRQSSGIPPKPVKSYEEWQQSPGTD